MPALPFNEDVYGGVIIDMGHATGASLISGMRCAAKRRHNVAPADAAGADDARPVPAPRPAFRCTDAGAFGKALGEDLAEWREKGKRGIWLRLPQLAFGLLACAVDEHGFEVHHCQPGSVSKDGKAYIMLTLWLPTGVPNRTCPSACAKPMPHSGPCGSGPVVSFACSLCLTSLLPQSLLSSIPQSFPDSTLHARPPGGTDPLVPFR